MAQRALRCRDEHDAVQKKTFTKWINGHFSKTGKTPIKDMFSDLRDGRKLLDLLESLTGSVLTKERGSTRVHALNNVNRVLQVLHQNSVDLVNIGGTDIVDGNHKLTLGLIWSIILHWQVKDIMKDIMSNLQQTNSEKILLSWVRQSTRSYDQVNVLNFTTSWADGLAFNAVLHHFRPSAFSWEKVQALAPVERMQHAFTVAKDQLGIERLLDPEDVAVQLPDKKSIIMYVTSLFAVLPKEVTMDDIREVETLPRRFKAEAEVGGVLSQQRVTSEEDGGGSPRAETPSTVTEVEVDLDGYQATLEEVLTWLLSAEDSLQMQDDVSEDVEEVKDQFHTHEAFMMELTAHQSSVGNVLQAGNQLMAQGNLSEEEEEEIREQMALLNSRWENLRVASMDRQARLHEVLMDLQQQQLQQLSDWLTLTEERIRKMEMEPMAGHMEGYRVQIDQHKALQNDLEMEQVKVNSLTHMVVVVDENCGESATAVLEDQLQSLGERWAAVCRWTEERWHKLQDTLLVWQQLAEDQGLFKAWLTEKEEALGRVQTSNFKDPNEINTNVRSLAVLKEDMEMKRRTLDQLTDAGQDVVQLLRNAEAAGRIDGDMEDLTQRWDNLVQRLEDCSNQVTESVTSGEMPRAEQRVATVTVATAEEGAAKAFARQELPPPPPPKRRQLQGDQETRKVMEDDFPEILKWVATWKSAVNDLDFAEYQRTRDVSEAEERLKPLEAEISEKEPRVKEVTQGARNLLEQMEKDGMPSEEVRDTLESVEEQWKVCKPLLVELKERFRLQERISAHSAQIQVLNRAMAGPEEWLRTVGGTTPEEANLEALNSACEARLAELVALGPRMKELAAGAAALASEQSAPAFLREDSTALSDRYAALLEELQNRDLELSSALASAASQEMQVVMETTPSEFEEMEARISALRGAIVDVETAEEAVEKAEALCVAVEQQRDSDPAELQRWSELSCRAQDELGALRCLLGSLKDTQVTSAQVQKWLDGVQAVVARDVSTLGDAEKLQEDLNQCTEFVNDMETVETALKQMEENVSAVQTCAVPGLTSWGQPRLGEHQGRWKTLSKQLLSRREWVSEIQEKAGNLRKDLAEMREWMGQVDEEFLMRDFEYKSPEDLEGALEEMKRAKEDVLQKEVRVKILKDNINTLVAKSPPGGQDLTADLGGVLKNYQKLCDRFKSKCHTLEEVWSCWIELLQYLEMENTWLNNLEERVQASENLPESSEAIGEALESLESVLRHPGDNRTQIRELGQTLIDGGILDEIISEKLEAFNGRYDQLSHQAVNRQISLEQQLPQVRESEQTLQALQASLSQLDQTLTSYLTDRVDALQLPQEAQAIQAEIAAHEASLEDLRRRNVGNFPAVSPEGKASRGGYYAGPAAEETPRDIHQRVLEGAKAELHVLDVREVDPEEIQSRLNGCMKLYKVLSEVKLEVETVIKTGRQIVQKQQTENPKGMDEQLTALKLLYNDLGAQVTEGKQDLEKALALSHKLQKEGGLIRDWMSATEAVLDQKNSAGSMPADIDAEIGWANGLLKELERRKADLTRVTESSATLQGLVEGSEETLEERLCALNAGWSRVRTGTEDWLSTVLNHQNEVEIFDENLAHISTWLYQTEIHLDETEKLPANEKEEVVKALQAELKDVSLRVDSVRDQAVILMTSRGAACREVVEPKLADLNRNFDKVSQHIRAAKMSTSLEPVAVEMKEVVEEVQAPETLSSSQLLDFEGELLASLTALDTQQDPAQPLAQDDDKVDEEKARLEEVLRRGEEVLLQIPDEGRREALRRNLLRLQMQYTTLREFNILRMQQPAEVSHDGIAFSWPEQREEPDSGLLGTVVEQTSPEAAPSAEERDEVEEEQEEEDEEVVVVVKTPSLMPSDYLLDINKVLLAMADNELLLNSTELSSGLYEDFSCQEDALKNIQDSLERLGDQVALIHERQPDAIQEASRAEVIQIGDALTQLNAEWDRINRMYNDRKGCFDKAVEEWRHFHCDLNDLGQWVSDTEQVLADGKGPDGAVDPEKVKAHQEELEEGLISHQPILSTLNQAGERIIGQLSAPDSNLLEEKLETLNQRWRNVHREIRERRRRLAGGDPAVAELARRSEELALWLEQAECAAGALPVAAIATDKNLKELKALSEEMDAQNERMIWLNKNGPHILASKAVSLQERDHHMTRLRAINMNWSNVTRDLLDKVGEVETHLQGAPGTLSPSENQVLEASLRERKRELEELLSRSIELQKRQLLLPQEKSKVEQLASDWKALDVTVKEVTRPPLSSWTQQVAHQSLSVSAVPPAVQMASLMSADPRHQTPGGPDLVGPTDLNETATELGDWLLLIDQMLKSNIVTVGDVDEIRTISGRLQVTKSDLEQRHTQLEAIFTLAQNIKNKTSNLDVRTSITEKLEKVRCQWDNTQHGVEARLLQLDHMITHSNQWEEQRREVNALIGQSEARLHNLQLLTRDPLTKQLSDGKVFVQDLSKGQATVASFNELSAQLLQEYEADDTRKIKEVTDTHTMAWNAVNNRARDRQACLDADLKALQASLKELEGFLKWLQEAETTVNVLADASQREELSQDSAHIKELRGQLEYEPRISFDVGSSVPGAVVIEKDLGRFVCFGSVFSLCVRSGSRLREKARFGEVPVVMRAGEIPGSHPNAFVLILQNPSSTRAIKRLIAANRSLN
ncbi:hypothetical protein SKAU_G00185180 [Synaphobranchus kaupii]|uniref:Calponin-homology (CH) domain-containing protein n=1 Tax=Synaphobranchus kaupii TaxID=118154 RepID=A0A9Q1FCK4_SYNKA|nr:hypothetical protein SKAU_G00185180 [Synaphobranchus kaupii]